MVAFGSGAPAAIVAGKQRLKRTAFPSCVGARLSEACPAACATAHCRLLCAAGSCPLQGWRAAALRVKATLGCSCWFKGSELLCCTADMSQQRCTEGALSPGKPCGAERRWGLERPSGERTHLSRVGPRGQGATRYLTRWRNPSAKSMKTGRKIPMPWKLGEEDFFA